MRLLLTIFVASAITVPSAFGEVTMEKKPYEGWENCIHLSNGKIELVATTDIGPRIMHFGFPGGQNLMNVYPEEAGKTGGDEWRIYGGHRLWHAPEASPRTYWPDNSPVDYGWDGKTLTLTQETEGSTGIAKVMKITMAENDPRVTIEHTLINNNLWEVELAPWALTVLAQGGRCIIPNEEFRPHPDYLLPARPVVVWHYTDMSDPRWTWGEKYIQLQQDPNAETKTKAAYLNKQGWSAYTLGPDLFVKTVPYEEGADYTDMGVNNETFTNADMLELETVGPVAKLAPEGGSVDHTEHWFLFELVVGEDEADIDYKLPKIVERIKEHVAGLK